MNLHKADCLFASEINLQEEKIMCLKIKLYKNRFKKELKT